MEFNHNISNNLNNYKHYNEDFYLNITDLLLCRFFLFYNKKIVIIVYIVATS